MNKKIMDLIDEVKSLQNQARSLDEVMQNEIKTSHERLAKTLVNSGVIHIQCDHNSVQTTEKPDDNLCQGCNNRVAFKYGINVTEAELGIINGSYKHNTKVGQIDRQIDTITAQFAPICDKIEKQLIADLKKAGLILSNCTHENPDMYKESNNGFCHKCQKGVKILHGMLLNDDEVKKTEQVGRTLPVRLRTGGYDWRNWV